MKSRFVKALKRLSVAAAAHARAPLSASALQRFNPLTS
jgi:hypothetical protein